MSDMMIAASRDHRQAETLDTLWGASACRGPSQRALKHSGTIGAFMLWNG